MEFAEEKWNSIMAFRNPEDCVLVLWDPCARHSLSSHVLIVTWGRVMSALTSHSRAVRWQNTHIASMRALFSTPRSHMHLSSWVLPKWPFEVQEGRGYFHSVSQKRIRTCRELWQGRKAMKREEGGQKEEKGQVADVQATTAYHTLTFVISWSSQPRSSHFIGEETEVRRI